MKKYIYSGLVLMAAVLLNSCADDSKQPILTFEQLGKGGYPRLLEVTSGEYDLNNISSSNFSYMIELVTIDKGANVQSYEVNVNFNGGANSLWKSFGQGDFTTNAAGFKEISVSIPLSEAAATTGVDVNNLVAGDKFTFDTKVILTDGTSFAFGNSSAAVNGTAFKGFFKPSSIVTCPMTDAQYVGTYKVEYVNVANAPNCFNGAPTLGTTIPNMSLSVVSGSTTKRTLTPAGGTIPWAFGLAYSTGTLDFVCDVVFLAVPFELNADCSDGIFLTGGDSTPMDFNNESTFDLNVHEFSNNDCGCPEVSFRLRYTKI